MSPISPNSLPITAARLLAARYDDSLNSRPIEYDADHAPIAACEAFQDRLDLIDRHNVRDQLTERQAAPRRLFQCVGKVSRARCAPRHRLGQRFGIVPATDNPEALVMELAREVECLAEHLQGEIGRRRL